MKAKSYVLIPSLLTLIGMVPAWMAAQASEPPAGATSTQAGNPDAGQRRFAACAACHNIEPGEHSKFGPDLHGVVGRKAASVPNYRYSSAMRDANLVWDEATLNRFLSDPDEVVPGSRMSIIGLSDPQARADIIAYLKKASK